MDSDRIRVSKKYRPDDMTSMLGGLVANVNWKLIFLLYMIFLLLSSDVFINRVLAKSPDCVGYTNTPTPWGTMVQGILLILGYMIADVLIKKEII
jgi:hypothetical protein